MEGTGGFQSREPLGQPECHRRRGVPARSLSAGLDNIDPSKASEWAARIRYPEWRANRLEWAVRRWMKKNRGAAFDWLENSNDLSKEERKELRSIR